MATPHNEAACGAFGKAVLLPGDPLRARFAAEHFLTAPELVNNVRGAQGYTGLWKGVRVSVMGSGMGMPSIGIHSYELFHSYGVECILRIGSAGAIDERVQVRDLVLGMGACTDSCYGEQFHLPGAFAPIADWELLQAAAREAAQAGVPFHVGNLLSTDVFYRDDPADTMAWGRMGVLAVEMEAAALYMNAARAGKRALSICTISDHLLTGAELSSAERQNGFAKMIGIALDTAVQFC